MTDILRFRCWRRAVPGSPGRAFSATLTALTAPSAPLIRRPVFVWPAAANGASIDYARPHPRPPYRRAVPEQQLSKQVSLRGGILRIAISSARLGAGDCRNSARRRRRRNRSLASWAERRMGRYAPRPRTGSKRPLALHRAPEPPFEVEHPRRSLSPTLSSASCRQRLLDRTARRRSRRGRTLTGVNDVCRERSEALQLSVRHRKGA